MSIWRKLFSKKVELEQEFKIPAGELVYAVGDIHGRADLLQSLLEKITEDLKSRAQGCKVTLVFLGDYIDRGFHSKEVIDILLSLRDREFNTVFLAGNHEDMLLQFIDDPAAVSDLWLKVGGVAALASYGVFLPDCPDFDAIVQASNQLADTMPRTHLAFLKELKEHYKLGDYYFVHAGIRPGVVLDAQVREDKLSIREEFTQSNVRYGCKVVHGHSVVRVAENKKNRIGVDTAAFATGILTAVILENSNVGFMST